MATSTTRTLEFIRISPRLLWVVFAMIAYFSLRNTIVNDVIPRVRSLSAFSLKIELEVREGLEAAAMGSAANARPLPGELIAVTSRARHAAPFIAGARVLWLDDDPEANLHEMHVFETLGLLATPVTTEKAALARLQSPYPPDIFISDIRRGDAASAGIQVFEEIRSRGLAVPTIFYIQNFKPELGTPAYAFGIANRPDDLLHLVIDILERRRAVVRRLDEA